MQSKIQAIPTEHAGILFRSFLEARWAVAFDLLGLSWNYEPVALSSEPGSGYIPDFLVDARVFSRPQVDGPTLVEVRPITEPAGFRAPIAKIAKSGWRGPAVVLGACVWTKPTPWGRESIIGRGHPSVSEAHANPDSNEWFPVGYRRDLGLFCMGGDDIDAVWREATRRSQWMPSRT